MLFSLLLWLLSMQESNAQDKFDPKFDRYANYSMDNWTSCDQFLINTTFDRMKLVDIDWKIFYFWSMHVEESYNVRFSVPTPTLVDRFRVELDQDIAPPVNWTDADLFMETSIDFSGLFIKTNTSGLYKMVPSLAFQFSHIPVFMFAMKLVEPENYLGVMNCRQRLCYAMAPANKMPDPDKLATEAKKLGFYGEFARSHVEATEPPPTIPIPDRMELDDADEDEQFEIEKDPQNIQIL